MPGQTDKPVVTRFAPSPTGNLHIGGARTALFAWAFARKHGGQLILRIEDTDRARSTPESTRGILRDLTWLGLDWDQGPAPGSGDTDDPYDRSTQLGGHGPYFQSLRHKDGIYNELVQKLLDSGQAYEDGDAVRFRMDKDVSFNDVVYGPIEIKAADLEDFIIRKGEKGGGLPTFHFAVTVDDALMQVTHVIRGQEHLANTPKHAALCDALGFDRPQWVHLPSIMNADGSKMSKRDKAKAARVIAEQHMQMLKRNGVYIVGSDGPDHWKGQFAFELRRNGHTTRNDDDVIDFLNKQNDDVDIAICIERFTGKSLPEIDVADFKEHGYLPKVLLNYIALLGWNPGDETERFDLNFLVEHFSLKRIGKKNSQFDRTKLLKFTAEALEEMPADNFHKTLHSYFSKNMMRREFIAKLGEAGFKTFAEMYQARSQTLITPAQLGRFFVDGDFDYVPKAVKKNLVKNDGEGLDVLKQFRDVLEKDVDENDWTSDTLHTMIESFVEKKEHKNMGSVAQPLRVALTGNAVSPEIGPTLELLGKETVLKRIDRCVEVNSTLL